MNPYLAGVLIGLVLLGAMVISGRGLGASGGIKYCVVSIVGAVSQERAATADYYSKYYQEGKKPINNWLVFQIMGMVSHIQLSGFPQDLAIKFEYKVHPYIGGSLGWFVQFDPASGIEGFLEKHGFQIIRFVIQFNN